ncbi:MAG: class I SAM-dependent methyltransferase [Erysipelotrichaceae bacterium]|nr:class I SAM-dependent methyltransferase [Erysipelotrichaceae bacterium]
MKNYQEHNSKMFDRWNANGWRWGQGIDHETYEKALHGDYAIYLTPTRKVPEDWLGDIKGKQILGLAAGGGQQMPILSALGGICTLVDLSDSQLRSDELIAKREGYDIRLIKADMSKPLPFKDESFDLIIHPVSNCYVKDVLSIWKECYRVLKHGGRLLSGTDHYINYIVDEREERIINSLPFDPLVNKEQEKQLLDTDSGYQFSHTLEEQITGQLKAGFILKDLYEDSNGEGRLHDLHIPTMLAILSEKK